MSKNPWFRLYTETVDDEKLRLLAFEDRWHFVALLCCKGSGLLDSGDEPGLLRRKLAVKLGLSPRELEEVARRLAEVGLIDPDTLQPLAWDDRQFKSDTSSERVRKYRERMKRTGNVSVTAQETDTDTEEEQDQEQKKGRAKKLALPDWLEPDAWSDWHTFRNSRKGWTTRARELSLRKLTQLHDTGHDPRAVIEQSIERGWTGLFPLKEEQTHETPRKLSSIERIEANVRRGQQHDADGFIDAKAIGHAG